MPALEVSAGMHSSGEFWLRVTPDGRLPRGLVEMRYTAGLADRGVRPVLRFVRADASTRDVLMPAPVAGIGIWRGRIPTDAAQVLISPSGRPGSGAFALL